MNVIEVTEMKWLHFTDIWSVEVYEDDMSWGLPTWTVLGATDMECSRGYID